MLYGYQCDDNGEWLFDPYAKILDASSAWAAPLPMPLLGSIQSPTSFDWEGATHPNIPKEALILYEMHLRGFTAHPSSGSQKPGTYRALIEKIPYLQKLGINAVELMPIYEFDETRSPGIDPVTHEKMPNYWGYDPLSYFSPKRNYSAAPTLGGSLTEFKSLVKELHKNNIELILDVVYNHTGKASLQQIDPETYYMHDPAGKNLDYTGCGHTVNVNHPSVEELILESLRYWVTECQVDGFRFDLASILTRAQSGHPLDPSPLLAAIQQDPILSKRKLIAEAWDATGLYQVGSFPKWGPWSEWNGRYRDIIRRFIKGTNEKAGLFANALCGSDFLYAHYTPLASVNFITAHDGFCLRDLVTYQSKHNWANGEKNRDGSDHNDSWNCGAEGPTKDPNILALREQQMRNFWLALLLSQGIPMILMGDEYGHTRHGNNNPYVQDNELNWFLWYELEEKQPIFQFVQDLITFRKNHPEFRQTHFLSSQAIDWHGYHPFQPDWSPTSRFVAFSTKGEKRLYIAFNAHYMTAKVELPGDSSWRTIVGTQYDWGGQWFEKEGPILKGTVDMPPHTALLLKEACN
jgi:isoamylase/glycogen operon protein